MQVKFSSVFIYPYRPNGGKKGDKLLWIYAPQSMTLQSDRLIILPETPSNDFFKGNYTAVPKDAEIIARDDVILPTIRAAESLGKTSSFNFSQRVHRSLLGLKGRFFERHRSAVLGSFSASKIALAFTQQDIQRLSDEYSRSFGLTTDEQRGALEKKRRLKARRNRND